LVGVTAGGNEVQVRLLGPVDVLVAGQPRPVRGMRRKAVLAVLALHRGDVVSTDRLLDIIWADAPPRTALNSAQSHVSYLRQVLESKTAVRASSPGYRLELGPDGSDVEVAERLIRHSAQAADPGDRAGQLRTALALWRGRPLADVGGIAWLAEQAERLDRLRLQATRELVEARLALGENAQLVPELEQLTGEHPFDEQIHGQLMRALYRSGRQADALAAFRRLRHTLSEDMGIDPSQPLRDLEAAILRQDPALDMRPPAITVAAATAAPAAAAETAGDVPAAAEVPAAAVDVPVPAQLPPGVSAFTGRDRELATLDSALASTGGQPSAVVISAVSGTAGVGKTALAVQWAHRVRPEFPDGQLYVNLRGYDPDQPVTAAQALAGFLGGLGVTGQNIPPDLDERAARYRSEIAGRRMLVVLDNAGSVEQVRPLLPGTPSAMVLVTSRDSLAGLVALHGARRLDLDLLPAADALDLLRELIGERVDADPEAAASLAEQCARLPLALRVAAELAAARPADPLAGLVAELADQRRRLDLLDAGEDPRAGVTAVFSWSVRQLPADAARVFALLGSHPGQDADAYAAAALADLDLDRTRRILAALGRAHLVHPTGPGRYGMHDLLRAYSTGLAAADDVRAALDRLFDYYLATAAAAADSLFPAEAHRRPRIPPAATPAPDLTDPDTARSWLDTERANLVAVAVHAATYGWPAHAVRLAATLFRYLSGSHYTDGHTVHSHALHAAELAGDRAGEAQARHDLGTVYWSFGRSEPATESLQQALVLFREVGDRIGEARALGNLGSVEQWQSRYGPAGDRFRQALALFRQIGDRVGEAWALTSVGIIEERLGRNEPALEMHQQALVLYREVGDRLGEAQVLTGMGGVETRLGRYAAAVDHYRQALALYRLLGNRDGQGWTMTGLGTVHARLGRPGEATAYHEQALAIFRAIGGRDGTAWALNGLGEAAYAAGNPVDARTHHTAALAAAQATGGRDQRARAHTGLGRAHHVLGHPTRARRHLQHALDLYTEFGALEADQVRADLAALDQARTPDEFRVPTR
jgi:DNA-binding SARP family transcriptional activator/tetratricopeptide (TPR) repeat protein